MVVPLRPAERPAASDDELAERAAQGEEAAFRELVARYQPRVLGVAHRRLGDRELAIDVAQDTFVDLHRALPRYEARGRFAPFLFTLLLNRCRMAKRARARRLFALARFARAPVREPPRPDELAEARERRERMWAAVADLSEGHRTVVELRMAGQMSVEEVACVLGLPPGTVKSRLSNALARIRERLLAEEEAER